MIRFNISKYKEAICLHLQKIEFNNKKWCENCGSLIPKVVFLIMHITIILERIGFQKHFTKF